MVRVILYCLLISGALSCQKQTIEKPVFINQSDSLFVPFGELIFQTDQANWNAILYTVFQPIELNVYEGNDSLILNLKNETGLVEGPAKLILSSEGQFFEYPVHIKNTDSGEISSIDYRSSKTIHVDYGLSQQRILHKIDEFRNIRLFKGDDYFYSDIITVSSNAGIYRADPNISLSSYYVQPGQSVNIQLSYTFDRQKNSFVITTVNNRDQYGNTISDGTIISFIYSIDNKIYREEKAILDGGAKTSIPDIPNETIRIYAMINNTFSKTIKLEK
jgi:hypothetical protein